MRRTIIFTVCLTQLTDTGFVIGVTSVGYSFNVVQILIERSGQPDTAAVSAIILGKSEIYHRGGGTNDTFPGYAWELWVLLEKDLLENEME